MVNVKPAVLADDSLSDTTDLLSRAVDCWDLLVDSPLFGYNSEALSRWQVSKNDKKQMSKRRQLTTNSTAIKHLSKYFSRFSFFHFKML